MSLGYYRLIHGRLLVREKQSPDGDSIHFAADDMSLFEDLPQWQPARPSTGGPASFQLRLQAIDTPELHYGGAAQPHGLESRNGLLHWLGQDPAQWPWAVAPAGFHWEQPASILCDGFDRHGRPIAFLLPRSAGPDGADTKLDKALLHKSFNHHAALQGLAYLGLYEGGLAPSIRAELVAACHHARLHGTGLWALDCTSDFQVRTLADLSPGQPQLIYPKVFRRCVDALRWAGGSFQPGHDLADFLAARPPEDDSMVLSTGHGHHVRAHLHAVLRQANQRLQVTVDLNSVDFVSK